MRLAEDYPVRVFSYHGFPSVPGSVDQLRARRPFSLHYMAMLGPRFGEATHAL
jgi:hypothetical protein